MTTTDLGPMRTRALAPDVDDMPALARDVLALLDLVDAHKAEIEGLKANIEYQARAHSKLVADYESRLTASASGRNAGEVAREIVADWNDRSYIMDGDREIVTRKLTEILEARDLAHAGREERMRKELEEIELACERAAHPAAPVCLSETHVAHLQQIASKCRAALADQPASPAPVTETTDHD